MAPVPRTNSVTSTVNCFTHVYSGPQVVKISKCVAKILKCVAKISEFVVN